MGFKAALVAAMLSSLSPEGAHSALTPDAAKAIAATSMMFRAPTASKIFDKPSGRIERHSNEQFAIADTSNWTFQTLREFATQDPILIASSYDMERLGSFMRLVCRNGQASLQFNLPRFAFKTSEELVRVVSRFDNKNPTAGVGYGVDGESVIRINLTKTSYLATLAASLIDVLFELPDDGTEGLSFRVAPLPEMTEKFEKGCSPDNAANVKPVELMPNQVARYLHGRLDVDWANRSVVETNH